MQSNNMATILPMSNRVERRRMVHRGMEWGEQLLELNLEECAASAEAYSDFASFLYPGSRSPFVKPLCLVGINAVTEIGDFWLRRIGAYEGRKLFFLSNV